LLGTTSFNHFAPLRKYQLVAALHRVSGDPNNLVVIVMISLFGLLIQNVNEFHVTVSS